MSPRLLGILPCSTLAASVIVQEDSLIREGPIVAENVPSSSHESTDIQTRLRDLAKLLREADHLDPETQEKVAEIAEGLASAVDLSKVPHEEVAHLLDVSAQAITILQSTPHGEVPKSMRDRLRLAMLDVELKHPVIAGLTHRFLNALADIGI